MSRGREPLVFGNRGEHILRFGTCRLDRARGLLHVNGTEVWLPPKALEVLEYLLQRPAAVVSRAELLSTIWNGTAVTDHSLTDAVCVLRQALGDDPRNPTYVQTVHRRGYGFVADVQPESTQQIRGTHHSLCHHDGQSTIVPVHGNETMGRGLLTKSLRNYGMSWGRLRKAP